MRSKWIRHGVPAALLALAPAAVLAMRAPAESTALAARGVAESVGFRAATGPELAPADIAGDAVAYARRAGEGGEIGVQMAQGRLDQAEAVMEGETPAAGARPEAGNSFCFTACTAGEEAQARQERSQEAESSVYLVTLTGRRFTPAEHLKHGAKPITGKTMTLIIDARTGNYRDLTIGGRTGPALGELGTVTTLIAAARSSTVIAATSGVPTKQKARKAGSIVGSLNVRGQVVVFAHTAMVARVKPHHGRFEISIEPGSYRIAGRRPSGRYCASRPVEVAPRRETRVVLSC